MLMRSSRLLLCLVASIYSCKGLSHVPHPAIESLSQRSLPWTEAIAKLPNSFDKFDMWQNQQARLSKWEHWGLIKSFLNTISKADLCLCFGGEKGGHMNKTLYHLKLSIDCYHDDYLTLSLVAHASSKQQYLILSKSHVQARRVKSTDNTVMYRCGILCKACALTSEACCQVELCWKALVWETPMPRHKVQSSLCLWEICLVLWVVSFLQLQM